MDFQKKSTNLTDGSSKTRWRTLIKRGSILLLSALVACTGLPSPGITVSNPTRTTSVVSRRRESITTQTPSPISQRSPKSLEVLPIDRDERSVTQVPGENSWVQTQPAPMNEGVPDEIVNSVFDDLVNRAEVDYEEIQIIRAEAVVWRDGSLGCPQKGMRHLQVLVEGYWIVLQVEGEQYDYRVSDTGYFLLCEWKGSLPISTPDLPPDK